MVDLYKRLGVSPDATAGQIVDACARCKNRKLNDDVKHVLLNEGRRQAYDRIHGQLGKIGQLRANLGLDNYGDWRIECGDFCKSPTVQGSLMDRMQRRYGKKRHVFLREHWKTLALAWISVFSIGVGVITAKLSSNDRSNFNQPVLRLPASGVMSKTPPFAKSTIVIQSVPNTTNLYVKIVDGYKETAVGFLRSGEKIVFELPLGTYDVKMASGTEWYGESHLFGPNTKYRKIEGSIKLLNDTKKAVLINRTTKLSTIKREEF